MPAPDLKKRWLWFAALYLGGVIVLALFAAFVKLVFGI